jgi:hypothetical protein
MKTMGQPAVNTAFEFWIEHRLRFLWKNPHKLGNFFLDTY